MTTVDMLDAYTRFSRRVHREKEGDQDRLNLLATMMDYMFRLGHDQQCLIYWPFHAVTLTLLSCMVRETVCLDDNGYIQFAVNPLSFMNNHYDGMSQQCCCKYCHFSGVTFRGDEFIPSVFVKSLFEKIKHRHRESVTTVSVVLPQRKRTFSEIHTINVSSSDVEKMKPVVPQYTHYRDNSDITKGYTLTGALEGQHFELNMTRAKGIVGVSPINPTTLYTFIVSSSATLRLESYSLDSPTRYIAITIIDPSRPKQAVTIPYNALHHGFALHTLTNGLKTINCRIESNDSLIVMFNEYSEENTLSIKGPCKCMCNVDYSLYTLSYNEENTTVPLNSHININPFIKTYCLGRSQHNKKEYGTHLHHSIPPGVPSNKVNESIDTFGSMETYIDMVDLIARIKITDTGADKRIPEFYLASKGLSVRQLRRGCGSEKVSVTPLISNGNEIDPTLLWSIFYNYRAVALFDVCGRNVSFTPIGPGEQFEVVNYVVY